MSDQHAAFATPEFLDRLRAGDPGANRDVVHAYLAQIVRAARGAGLRPEEAEDVAQSTFVTFLEAVGRFEGRSHIRTFLFGILYKKIAETRRRLARDNRADAIDNVMESRFRPDGRWLKPPRPIDSRFHDIEVRRQIDDCLEGLPLQQRMAFVLREVEGLLTEEARKILEVTRTNFGVLLYRARNRLRECLESKGVEG